MIIKLAPNVCLFAVKEKNRVFPLVMMCCVLKCCRYNLIRTPERWSTRDKNPRKSDVIKHTAVHFPHPFLRQCHFSRKKVVQVCTKKIKIFTIGNPQKPLVYLVGVADMVSENQ